MIPNLKVNDHYAENIRLFNWEYTIENFFHLGNQKAIIIRSLT